MRVLVAPQEFKGTLSAATAAAAMARGLSRGLPGVELDVAPIADGGPGTVSAFVSGGQGELRTTRVKDPLGRPVEATWGLLDEGRTAVLEAAAAAGLTLLAPEERNPWRSSTFGVGELIRAALDAGCERILVGVGGSATNDGGVGAATALGARFLDSQGQPLPWGAEGLRRLARIDLSALDPRLPRSTLVVLTDVQNPLCGLEGASHVYGPQKGADWDTAVALDAALEHLAHTVRTQLGKDLDNQPGAGAAGGLAFGLAAFCAGRISPGFDAVCQALNLYARVLEADVVVTGEGQLDRQSAYFKGPFALARLARMQGKRTCIFAGAVGPGSGSTTSAFDEVVTVTPRDLRPAELKARAAEFLEGAVEQWARQQPRS